MRAGKKGWTWGGVVIGDGLVWDVLGSVMVMWSHGVMVQYRMVCYWAFWCGFGIVLFGLVWYVIVWTGMVWYGDG